MIVNKKKEPVLSSFLANIKNVQTILLRQQFLPVIHKDE
jgi:hypothetical protein